MNFLLDIFTQPLKARATSMGHSGLAKLPFNFSRFFLLIFAFCLLLSAFLKARATDMGPMGKVDSCYFKGASTEFILKYFD